MFFISKILCLCLVMIHEPSVLIEGVLFRARYLGSTQLVCEGQPTKSTRMMQAEEAVSRIKVKLKVMCMNAQVSIWAHRLVIAVTFLLYKTLIL